MNSKEQREPARQRILRKLISAGKKLGRFSFLMVPCIFLFLFFCNILKAFSSFFHTIGAKLRNIFSWRLVFGILGALFSVAVIVLAVMIKLYGDRLIVAPAKLKSDRIVRREEEIVRPFNENPYENAVLSVSSNEPETELSDDLRSYRALLKQNRDFVGWITVEGTQIDEPVMYTPYDPEKYLHRSFTQEESKEGLPFIDYRCHLNPDSDNLIIYGHNMKNGDMFAALTKYKDESFFKQHPSLRFDSVTEEREYAVLAAFYDRVYYEDENLFKFYNFIDAYDAEDFREAVSQFKQKSIYDTGVTAAAGDHLITLVTCTYQVENGRFVVVAKRI